MRRITHGFRAGRDIADNEEDAEEIGEFLMAANKKLPREKSFAKDR